MSAISSTSECSLVPRPSRSVTTCSANDRWSDWPRPLNMSADAHAYLDIGGLHLAIKHRFLSVEICAHTLNSEKNTKTNVSDSVALETGVCCCIINAVGEVVTVRDAIYRMASAKMRRRCICCRRRRVTTQMRRCVGVGDSIADVIGLPLSASVLLHRSP